MLKCSVCAGKMKTLQSMFQNWKKQRLQNDNAFISSIAKRGARNALLQQNKVLENANENFTSIKEIRRVQMN
jgi:hypothetical protein